MQPDFIGQVIDRSVAIIREKAAQLTDLDQAIGDGDHGINMKRGFDAIAEQRSELAGKPLGEALQKAGLTLVMKVGGASGPLYGSLLMSAGKALVEPYDAGKLASAWQAGIDAVKARGKATIGEKTLLDVQVPALEAFRQGIAAGENRKQLATRIKAAAQSALEATRPLQASKGRASFLGARSVGHLDPGATSSALLLATLADLLMETA